MKKVLSLLALAGFLWGASACQSNTKFALEAELTDFPENEPILVVYDDPAPKLDTIYPQGGKFVYAFTPDTLTLFRLVSAQGEAVPFFADQGMKVRFKGSFAQPSIEGDGENGEYGNLLESLRQAQDSTARMQAVEQFIQNHPESFASAYLINQFFIQTDSPDLDYINRLVAPLAGKVKDSHILGVILNFLPSQTETRQQRNNDYVNYFSCKDRNGEYVSWNSEKGSYTLLNFWASWDAKSVAVRDSLDKMIGKLPKKFKILHISLDTEKKKWQKACKEDSEQWIEVCDFKGWGTNAAKQNQIHELPANILINNSRKIIDKQLFGTLLYERVNQLIED